MKLKTASLILATLGIFLVAHAQEVSPSNLPSLLTAYRSYKDIAIAPISVPTVVEVPFANEFIERFDFAVLDKTTNAFEPHFFKQATLVNEIPVSLSTIPRTNNTEWMNDVNTKTYVDFLLMSSTEQGNAQVTLSSPTPITSSALTVLLDDNVALPTSVEIRARVNGQDRIVVARRRMDTSTVRFPQTTSNEWIAAFTFGQPLRISELRLNQDTAKKTSVRAVRFLAQPNHLYRVYFDPDRSATVPVPEAGNLALAKDILALPVAASHKNPEYIIADSDADGVPDVRDNCISNANSDQQDVNNNGRGDVCDDFDQDGVFNSADNCANNPNQNQRDTDSDGIGDVCDGQESRITERYPWIPWVGIGFAALVLLVLFALTAWSARTPEQDNNP